MSWAERHVEIEGRAVRVLETEGPAPGPTAVVLAGIHGDEPEPVAAVADVVERASTLTGGRLRVVPVANPAAWAAATRRAPDDGKDLARCFPGDAGGSFSDRLAHGIWTEVLEDADVLLDLHSAGLHYGMPLLAGCLDDGSPGAERSAAAARALGLPLLWLHDRYGPGRTVSAMAAAGKTAIYAESGGGPALDLAHVAMFVEAVERLLGHLGMARQPAHVAPPPRVVRGGGDLDNDVVRARCAGLFSPSVRPGSVISAGDGVGTVRALEGGGHHDVAAPRRSMVMMLRRTANVRLGDVIAAFATPDGQ